MGNGIVSTTGVDRVWIAPELHFISVRSSSRRANSRIDHHFNEAARHAPDPVALMDMFPADLNDPDAASVELSVLVAYLDELVHAVDTREREAIAELLAQPTATHLPRVVREELALFAAQPVSGFRAPIRFLRFRFRMLQLAAGEEPAVDPQLELGLGRGAGWRGLAPTSASGDDEINPLRPG